MLSAKIALDFPAFVRDLIGLLAYGPLLQPECDILVVG